MDEQKETDKEQGQQEKGQQEQSQQEQSPLEKKGIGIGPIMERCGAFFFDLGVVCLGFNLLLLFLSKTVESSALSSMLRIGELGFGSTKAASYIGGLLIWFLVITLFSWPYFAIFESSSKMATPGKRLAGLYVSDIHLKQISFLKASIRHFAKVLSFSVFGFGFLAAFASEQKQALHDSIVKTLVVREKINTEKLLIVLFVSGLFMLSTSAFLFKLSHDSVKKPVVVFNDIESKFKSHSLMINGLFTSDGKEIVMKDVVAVYDTFKERFRFYFFKDVIPQTEKEKLTKKVDLSLIKSFSPFFSAELGAARGSINCDKDSLRYQIYYRDEQKVTLSKDSVEKLVQSFNCTIVEKGKISAHFVKEAAIDNASEFWNIDFATELYLNKEPQAVVFDSKNSKEIFAYKNISQEGFVNIQIGYFSEPLTLEQKDLIRKNKNLVIEGVPKPQAFVSIDLKPEATEFKRESVVKYRIVIFRDVYHGVDFPGSEESLSRYDAPSEEDESYFSGLSGELKDAAEIKGVMSRSIKHFVGSFALDLKWQVDFNTMLHDLNVLVEDAAEAEQEPEGSFCKIEADNQMLELNNVVALYYPNEKDIAIGFYYEELDEKEKEQIRESRLIWNYVNDKRPNFVVFLDFNRNSRELNIENLISYSTFFLRDRHGRLYFPGSHDRIQFKRIDVEMEDGEIENLVGSFLDKAKLQLKMNAKRVSKKTGLSYSWSLREEIELLDVSKKNAEPKK